MSRKFWLQLAALCAACAIGSCAPKHDEVVRAVLGASADSLPFQLDAVYGSRYRLEIAALRDSLRECRWAAKEMVQNGYFPDGTRWPMTHDDSVHATHGFLSPPRPK